MVYIHKIFRNIIYVGTISFFYDSRPPDPRKGNRITKVLKIILYHPIRFIDHIQKILPMRLVNDIPRTNCVRADAGGQKADLILRPLSGIL